MAGIYPAVFGPRNQQQVKICAVRMDAMINAAERVMSKKIDLKVEHTNRPAQEK